MWLVLVIVFLSTMHMAVPVGKAFSDPSLGTRRKDEPGNDPTM